MARGHRRSTTAFGRDGLGAAGDPAGRVGSRLTVAEALDVLGLRPPVTPEVVVEARRKLAKRAHPDMGGATSDMALINGAAEILLAASTGGPTDEAAHSADTTSARPARSGTEGAVGADQPSFDHPSFDHPSFVVEALPVEAFEALLVVASWLGDVIDDEPPYVLEVSLAEAPNAWCRLELVPDAGASTVSLSVGGVPGGSMPNVEALRDQWVLGLNQLNWDDLQTP